MERMSLDVNKMTKDQLKQHILMLAMQLTQLEEENKTLKDNVEFLHSCLDDRDKSIAIMQEENEKLEKENKKLKEDVDYRHHRCMVAERGGEDEE